MLPCAAVIQEQMLTVVPTTATHHGPPEVAVMLPPDQAELVELP